MTTDNKPGHAAKPKANRVEKFTLLLAVAIALGGLCSFFAIDLPLKDSQKELNKKLKAIASIEEKIKSIEANYKKQTAKLDLLTRHSRLSLSQLELVSYATPNVHVSIDSNIDQRGKKFRVPFKITNNSKFLIYLKITDVWITKKPWYYGTTPPKDLLINWPIDKGSLRKEIAIMPGTTLEEAIWVTPNTFPKNKKQSWNYCLKLSATLDPLVKKIILNIFKKIDIPISETRFYTTQIMSINAPPSKK